MTKDTRVAKGSISFYIRTIMGGVLNSKWEVDQSGWMTFSVKVTRDLLHNVPLMGMESITVTTGTTLVSIAVNFVNKEGDSNSVLCRNAIAKG